MSALPLYRRTYALAPLLFFFAKSLPQPTAKDQSSHLLKFRQLQNRGLYFLRGYIMQTLTGLTQQVQSKIKVPHIHPLCLTGAGGATGRAV